MSDLDVYDDWVERFDAPTRQHVERMNERINYLTTALAAERARAEAAEGREARLRFALASLKQQIEWSVSEGKRGDHAFTVARDAATVAEVYAGICAALAGTPEGEQQEGGDDA